MKARRVCIKEIDKFGSHALRENLLPSQCDQENLHTGNNDNIINVIFKTKLNLQRRFFVHLREHTRGLLIGQIMILLSPNKSLLFTANGVQKPLMKIQLRNKQVKTRKQRTRREQYIFFYINNKSLKSRCKIYLWRTENMR